MYLGGANGLTIIRANTGGGGGGGGTSIAWQKDAFESTVVTSPPATYVRFLLSFTPISAFAVDVWFDGMLLHFDDWVLEDIGDGPQIRLLFPVDPSLGADGTKNVIEIRYPFAV